MGWFDGWFDDGSQSEVEKIRAEEDRRRRRITRGTGKITKLFDKQFNPAFFDKQATNFTNYALPQLGTQHADAAKQLTFALDRRGALDSSSRSSLAAELEKKRALAEADIKAKAGDYRTGAMADVEGARGDLINTLRATGDAQGAVQSANARATILSQVPAYNPLTALFADFTAGLGQQAAAEKAFSYGAGPRPTYSTGLFGTPRGAVSNS
jgi:hypothetical protein